MANLGLPSHNFALTLYIFRMRILPYSFFRSLFNCALLLICSVILYLFLILLLNSDFLCAFILYMHSPLYFSLNPFHYFSFYFSFSLSLSLNFLSLLQLSSLILSFFHNFPTYLFSVFPFI